MCLGKWVLNFFIFLLLTGAVKAQQLSLGNTPYMVNKSAVLELNSPNQGLLLPRLNDTAVINSMNPPNGMIIYFIPTGRLLLRTSGYWSVLAPSTSSINVATGTTGTDFNVSGSPVSLGGTLQLNLPSASSTARGLLTNADWNTFNSKQSALSFGNLTSTTTGVTVSGGTGAVIGSGAAVNIQNATTLQNGLLTSTDWNVFNNKVSATRTLNTTAPLSGGGDLSADRTLSMTQANSTTNGWLSSIDWNTFNNKQTTGNYITALTGDVTASGPGSAVATLANNVVTNTKFRQSAGLSVVGNAGSITANVADITAANDGEVLRRNGTALGFGTVGTSGITNSAVTYGKMQNVSVTNRLLGRASVGSGSIEEIALGTGLSYTGTTLNVASLPNSALVNSSFNFTTGTTGTDVSVTGSPVALGGTLTLNVPSASVTARGLLTPADWNTFNSKGNGSVTSVGLSMPSIFSVSNSPVTSAGTLTASLNTQTANLVFASPSSGVAAAPNFRSLVKADLPATVVHTDQSNAYTAGMKQSFQSSTTTAATNWGGIIADPTSLINGDVWHNTTAARFKYQSGNVIYTLATTADVPTNTNQLTNGSGYITNANVVFSNQANTYTAGMKQTFRGSTSNAGVSFGGALTADPTTLATGDLWYRADVGKLRYFDGTTSKYLATEGPVPSGSGTLNYLPKFTPDGNTLGNSQVVDNGTSVGINTASPNASSKLTVNGPVVVGTNGSVINNIIAFEVVMPSNLDVASGSTNAITITSPVTIPTNRGTVTVSPELALVDGIGIGYARINSSTTIVIRFTNSSSGKTITAGTKLYVTIINF